jgi:hypothetical protein
MIEFPDRFNISLNSSIPRYIPGLCFDTEREVYELYDCGAEGSKSPPDGCVLARLRPTDVPNMAEHLLPGTFIKTCCDKFGPSGIKALDLGPSTVEPGEQDLVHGAPGNENGGRSFATYEEVKRFMDVTESNQKLLGNSNYHCGITRLADRYICIYGKKSWIDAQKGAY